MGKVIPNRRWKEAKVRRTGARWFVPALFALPLAAFTAVLFFPATGTAPAEAEAAVGFAGRIDREEAYFPLCSGAERVTCVVDGDTIWYRGEKIRLVGFDTPEVTNPGCTNEARLGALATKRLQDWLNDGAFSLEANPEGQERDRYGRSLRVASRGGANVGEVLLSEGLAEVREDARNGWC